MWFGLRITVPSVAISLPGQPGPTPGAREIVTEGGTHNVISENNQELIIE